MTPALVLVDVQRDYLQRDDLTPAAEVLVAALAGLLADARARGWPVFHVQTRVRADASDAMPHWRAAGQALCVEGSEGAQAPEALTPEPGEHTDQVLGELGFGTAEIAALKAKKVV